MERNWWVWLLGPAAATTALLVTFAVAAGGDDDDPSRPAAATSTRTNTAAPPPPPPVTTSTTTARPPTEATRTEKNPTTTSTATTTTTTPSATTTTRRNSVVAVPDLYGTTQRQALDLLKTSGFRGRARRERSFAPEGLVFKQTPKPGKRSRQGTTVSFAVAFFPPRTPPLEPAAPPVSELPPVVGLDYSEAATRMEVLGIVADTYPVRASRRVTYIVRQTPAPGTRVNRGSRVKLTVSTGSGQLPAFEVPDTVGFKELRAHAICREGNFTCRTIVVSEGSAGRVVRQDPPAGQERRALSQMKLYVGG